jgi:hypothetical protein
LKTPPSASVAERFQVVKSTHGDVRKTEKGRAMLLWPETGPEGKWWCARWSDEDGATKIIGRSCRDAIYNCVENVEAEIGWDDEIIRQGAELTPRHDLDDTKPTTEPRPRGIVAWVEAAWNWALKRLRSNQTKKRLRVCETISLGEKRFVAVIEADGEQFLVGGAATSMATLAHLQPSHEFSDILQRRWPQNPVQA